MTVPVPANRSSEFSGSCRAGCKSVVTDEDRKLYAYPRTVGARRDGFRQRCPPSPLSATALGGGGDRATERRWTGRVAARACEAQDFLASAVLRLAKARGKFAATITFVLQLSGETQTLRPRSTPLCRCQGALHERHRPRSRDPSEGFPAPNVLPGTVTSIRQAPRVAGDTRRPGAGAGHGTFGRGAEPQAGHRLPRHRQIRRHQDRGCGRCALSHRGRGAAPLASERADTDPRDAGGGAGAPPARPSSRSSSGHRRRGTAHALRHRPRRGLLWA